MIWRDILCLEILQQQLPRKLNSIFPGASFFIVEMCREAKDFAGLSISENTLSKYFSKARIIIRIEIKHFIDSFVLYYFRESDLNFLITVWLSFVMNPSVICGLL